MIGYELSLGIFLKARPGNVLDVAERLTPNRSVNVAVAISGRYDLMAFATFKSPDEMSDFLINELGTLPGIMSCETVFINFRSLSNPLSVQNARLYL